MKTVILATDFSDNSKNAIRYAINLLGKEGIHYLLINTYQEISVGTSVAVSMLDLLRDESIKGVAKVREELIEEFGESLDIESRTYYGNMAKTINNLADERQVDYAVVGTRGASGLDVFIMGSNTLEAVTSIKVPLLVIPIHTQYQPTKKIALAADYQHLDDLTLLNSMTFIANRQDAGIEIIHVQNDDHTGTIEDATEGLDIHNVVLDFDHKYSTVQNENVIAGIDSFVKDNDIQMLTMITRKRAFFERLFHKSVTKGIAKLADIPLLVLHQN